VGSAEGLAEWLAKNPLTLLIFDELKMFVSKSTIESAVLLPCTNTLFENNLFHSHTKGHSIQIDNAYLSILAASTTDTFSRMWTPAFTDIGFLNRLWLVPDKAERRFAIPKPIPQSERHRLENCLQSLVKSIPSQLMTVNIDPQAQESFESWYKADDPSIYRKRLDTYGHRLMLLFCANEGKNEVTPDIASRVVSLLEWQRKVREEHDPIDADGQIAKMERTIRRSLTCAMGKRELQRRCHYERAGLFVWNKAISNLLNEGEIECDFKTDIFRRVDQ